MKRNVNDELVEYQNENNHFKSLISNISSIRDIFEILIIIWGVVAGLYYFALFLYNMVYFYYWKIDLSFYSQSGSNIINGLLYGILLFSIIALFSYSLYKEKILDDKSNKNFYRVRLFIAFTIVNFLFSSKEFFRYGFNLYSVFSLIFASFVFLQ